MRSAWTWTPLSARSQVKFSARRSWFCRPGDQLFDLRIEGLDANLELQPARRELRDEFPQSERQPVRHHLKVDEEAVGPAIQEELQDGAAGARVQVERAIDKFELPHAALQQPVHASEETVPAPTRAPGCRARKGKTRR